MGKRRIVCRPGDPKSTSTVRGSEGVHQGNVESKTRGGRISQLLGCLKTRPANTREGMGKNHFQAMRDNASEAYE